MLDNAIHALQGSLDAYSAWQNCPYAGEGGPKLEREMDQAFIDSAESFVADHGEAIRMALLVVQEIERSGVYSRKSREILEALTKSDSF